MKFLLVGGAGYIGSHMAKHLARHGHECLVLDNLSKGHRDAVRYGEFVEGDMADTDLLNDLFGRNRFDGVMHFASYIEVGESHAEPSKYYRNNFANTENLIEAMVANRVDNFVYSSTAAIFGEPRYLPIDEAHPCEPVSPYGRSKLMVELALDDFHEAYGLNFACLRYFNAAGADPEAELGERHEPESHLIPRVLEVAAGKRDRITVFGTDYDTPDGSCIRDYVHVVDLCEAHLLTMRQLQAGKKRLQYNLGNGRGFSVLEVIDAAERVSGCRIPVSLAARRPGDPARLVSDSTRAFGELGWKPAYADLDTIVGHAWNWMRRR